MNAYTKKRFYYGVGFTVFFLVMMAGTPWPIFIGFTMGWFAIISWWVFRAPTLTLKKRNPEWWDL